MIRPLALALALALATPALAEVSPRPGHGDPRIQTVEFDPAEVVALRVSNGYALTVQFAPDERIETVTLGDSGGWMVQTNKRADSLVVKPIGGGSTNLTVITDSRTYNFALYATFGGGMQPYLLSFTYPAPPQAAPVVAAPAGQYSLSGVKALWPVEMSDDGAFTRVRWDVGVAVPAIYSTDGWGKRALLNGVMRDGAYMVEGVFKRLVFVRGGDTAQAKRLKPARTVEAQP
jgi:type IV secretion system protein VirB9